MQSRKNQSRTTSRREHSSRSSDTQSESSFAHEIQIECDRLAEEIARLPAAVRQRLSEVEGSPADGYNPCFTNADLMCQLKQIDSTIRRRDATIQRLTTELDAHKREIQNLRAKEQSLRNYLHESESYLEVSEHEVVAAFVGLRQRVQRLVSSKMYQMDGRELCTESNVVTVDKHVSGLWQKASQPDRRLILRALVYKWLDDEILASKLFGIEEPDLLDSVACRTIESVTTGLSQFEHVLVKNKVSNDLVANWRLSTLKGVEASGMSRGVFGTALAKQMFDYFTAFIVDEATRDDREKLLEGFMHLCNEAYTLRLLMRKSRSNYQCLGVATGALQESTERYADVFGELEYTGNGRTTVVLTLFGGLGVQIRDSGETRFLEKAQIIVTRA